MWGNITNQNQIQGLVETDLKFLVLFIPIMKVGNIFKNHFTPSKLIQPLRRKELLSVREMYTIKERE